MATIKLELPWTYRDGVRLSIDYPAGEHEVADEVAAAFAAENPAKPEKAKATK
jgi:hypothetical protein